MIYRVIGLMSGSSLDGLDIAYVEFHENAGKWSFEILEADCYPYPAGWASRLKNFTNLSALEYQLLHVDYGHYLGKQVNKFIEQHHLLYKVALVASHGHTSFHMPSRMMTAQLGDGAALAAETQLPVVSDLRSLDLAFGGQGAPIVPIGEKLLWEGYEYFLNLGGIANISRHGNPYIAFDICPANRVLNLLASEKNLEFDEDGLLAEQGSVNEQLLEQLNELDYYKKKFPKSLANEFGTETVFPIVRQDGISVEDALSTYTEHIAIQVKKAVILTKDASFGPGSLARILITGGGALNRYLVNRLTHHLSPEGITIVLPEQKLINYKEAMIMALVGVLRWRQEYNVISSVTGASRDSIGGALWTGQEA